MPKNAHSSNLQVTIAPPDLTSLLMVSDEQPIRDDIANVNRRSQMETNL